MVRLTPHRLPRLIQPFKIYRGAVPFGRLRNRKLPAPGSLGEFNSLIMNLTIPPKEPTDLWKNPVVIARNNFKFKSLSSWSCNHTVGCSHGCTFCYVVSTSALKLKPVLEQFGVKDPDSEWGRYVLVRPFDEKAFLKSLEAAERLPASKLNPDGNRAVMFCTTTDPYQVIRNQNPEKQKILNATAGYSIRRALELIRDYSTLYVRILTRSPLAQKDFELFRSFGPRLLFGMSIPTLRNDLAKIYEPGAPAPTRRLETLRMAKEAGLHIYAAIAPTYPKCDREDLKRTMMAVASLEPVTIFHEPINIRAKNYQRIKAAALASGVQLNSAVFSSKSAWRRYAIGALKMAEEVAEEIGIRDWLHLWPDVSLGSKEALLEVSDPEAHMAWLQRSWSQISRWPK